MDARDFHLNLVYCGQSEHSICPGWPGIDTDSMLAITKLVYIWVELMNNIIFIPAVYVIFSEYGCTQLYLGYF